MLVFDTMFGKQLYDEALDAWSGTLSKALNVLCTQRALDIPTAEPDRLAFVEREFLLLIPSAVLVKNTVPPAEHTKGRIY